MIIRTVGGGFLLHDLTYDNLIKKAVIPFIRRHVDLINYSEKEKVVINYDSATYLRIFKTDEALGIVPDFLHELPNKAKECTQEVITEKGLQRTTLKPQSFLQAAFLDAKKQVFVIMKFEDKELDSTYKLVIRPLIENFNYKVIRVDEFENSGKINDQILKCISESEIILSDLTGERPNCYFEAGFALALNKEIIFTIKEGSKIHFDVKPYRFIIWKNNDDLKEKLMSRFQSIKEPVNFIESSTEVKD